jgi:ketosteroid isomerase-like protein
MRHTLVTHGVPMPMQATAAAPFTDQDRSAIRSRIAKFDKDALAGNWSAVASNYAEDAILLPPHAPMVRGRKAIQQFFEGFPKITEFKQNAVEIEGVGDLAFPWGTYEMAIASGATTVKDRGKVLAVWRKQPGGTWLVSRVCWNSDLAPVT